MSIATLCQTLSKTLPDQAFCDIMRGLEKENLRVDCNGQLAQTPHPMALGKALTNPNITTDFSEALPELITPPMTSINALQQYLLTLNRFVYDHLDQEQLWPFSMPPEITDELSIQIAQYGSSDSATMKTVYRTGLWHRYGRIMQAIAGLHFNLSFPDSLFETLQQLQQNKESFSKFRSNMYMRLTRHFHCHAWLPIYLFGASPLCFNTSVHAPRDYLAPFDSQSQFAPYSTSLRMSDLGYQNNIQDALTIQYDSIQNYAYSLLTATNTPHPDFERIGVKVDGEYKQLNSNILQIENEYYSYIRPKPKAVSGERPATSLCKQGVEYIEIRLLDLNPLTPLGIDEDTIAFLDLFLLFCLLDDCCAIKQACASARDNFKRVATRGRDPALTLLTAQGEMPFRDLALSLLQQLEPIATLLDDNTNTQLYQRALKKQIDKVIHPDKTPSAQLLLDIQNSKLSYQDYGLLKAKQAAEHLSSADYDKSIYTQLQQAAKQSVTDWQTIEKQPQDFDRYLAQYFSQG